MTHFKNDRFGNHPTKAIMKNISHFILLISTCWIIGGVTPCMAQIETLEVREGTGIPPEVYTIYEKGANNLASTQLEDGSWGVGNQRHGSTVSGISGLCVMAFLSTGDDPNFGNTQRTFAKHYGTSSVLKIQKQGTSPAICMPMDSRCWLWQKPTVSLTTTCFGLA